MVTLLKSTFILNSKLHSTTYDIISGYHCVCKRRAPRDQGLMRPKVLIIVPFREAALRTVNTLISLLIPKGQVKQRKS